MCHITFVLTLYSSANTSIEYFKGWCFCLISRVCCLERSCFKARISISADLFSFLVLGLYCFCYYSLSSFIYLFLDIFLFDFYTSSDTQSCSYCDAVYKPKITIITINNKKYRQHSIRVIIDNTFFRSFFVKSIIDKTNEEILQKRRDGSLVSFYLI